MTLTARQVEGQTEHIPARLIFCGISMHAGKEQVSGCLLDAS